MVRYQGWFLVLVVVVTGCATEGKRVDVESSDSGRDAALASRRIDSFIDELDPGVCWNDFVDSAGEVDLSRPPLIVDCARPHDNEMVAVVEHPAPGGADYPEPADLSAEAFDELCAPSWEEFLGRSPDVFALEITVIVPLESRWDEGDRRIACAVHGAIDELIGTARSGSLEVDDSMVLVGERGDGVDIWRRLDDRIVKINDDSAVELSESLSANEDVVVYARTDPVADGAAVGDAQIWSLDLATGTPTQLTDGEGESFSPDLSPDGRLIVFVSDRDGSVDLYMMNDDGSAVHRLTVGADVDGHPTWSPDGTQLAYRSVRDGDADIYILDAFTGDERRLTDDPGFDDEPAWSPDGTRIAFTSDRSGDNDVWVIDVDGGEAVNVSAHPANDSAPVWTLDGELVMFTSDRHARPDVWAVTDEGANSTNVTWAPSSGWAAVLAE